jgi:hypothetical protein
MTVFYSCLYVPMLQFPIKLEHTETDVTRLTPRDTTLFLTSIPHFVPVCSHRELLYPVHLTYDSYFTPRSILLTPSLCDVLMS